MVPEGVSFAPLKQAKQLIALNVVQYDSEEVMPLTLSQIADLRSLPLTTFALQPCTTEDMLALLQLPGPPLQWSQLPCDDSDFSNAVITNAVAALLPALPHLSSLRIGNFQWNDISSLAFLARMPQLRTLSVNLSDYQPEDEAQQRVSAFWQRSPSLCRTSPT